MGIWIFYILALIPVAVGGVLWLKNKEIVVGEWLGGSAVGFIVSLIFQFASTAGMTGDVETWSGQIQRATHHPRWVEQYQQMHTRTVGSGDNKRKEIYFTTEYRTHREHWVAYTTIPDQHEIDRPFFDEITKNFGGKIKTEQPGKSGFHAGDRNIYVAYNESGYIYPVTALKSWSNRVKAAPTLFSFSKVPKDAPVFPWPQNPDWRQSQRLLGAAAQDYDITSFDRMNARLGPRKRVNVIMAGFVGKDQEIGELQRAAWVGGKKNDLVLCYGVSAAGGNPTWARVFGWSDSEICKRKLETILMSGPPSQSILEKIEAEIIAGYKIKDWTAFDYITIEPPTWSYFAFGFVLVVSQVIFYLWAHGNDVGKFH